MKISVLSLLLGGLGLGLGVGVSTSTSTASASVMSAMSAMQRGSNESFATAADLGTDLGADADANAPVSLQEHASPSLAVNYTALSIETYEYGYPLIMEAATELAFLMSTPGASTNTFLHKRSFPATDDKSVVRPNQDTLYSTAFLDLSQGPLVMSIPATDSRQYYLLQLMDAWTNVFANPGSRTTGNGAQKYLIVGPSGVPRGVDTSKYTRVLGSPTNLVWIIARTLVRNDNFDEVHAIQDGYVLSSLSSSSAAALVAAPAPKGSHEDITRYLLSSLNADQLAQLGGEGNAATLLAPFAKLAAQQAQSGQVVSDKTVPELVEQLGGDDYFKVVSILMCRNPALLPQDARALQRYEALGFKPCRVFDPPTAALAAIRQAPRTVYDGFRNSGAMGDVYNGWRVMVTGLGSYGTQYKLRAAIAYAAIGANLPEDAVYPDTCSTSDGVQLDGSKSYSMTFASGALPPVGAFWSVTMYDSSWYLLVNPSAPVQRQKLSSVSSQPPLTYESDGSLRLVFQPTAPTDASKSSNWIPTLAGAPFCLTLRLYAPAAEVLNLSWVPPAVKANARPL